ncbi:hypothetical protein VP01_1442g1 [Puccinia sorghi]|uniref:Uncharacterized protein n=1 Tax=Puccinia sorghi TaxID=27349 RepID=A0A0L6VK71_9BASI|nr:hypothetical protein VP01_1442g1 [Puccinia sorghi]
MYIMLSSRNTFEKKKRKENYEMRDMSLPLLINFRNTTSRFLLKLEHTATTSLTSRKESTKSRPCHIAQTTRELFFGTGNVESANCPNSQSLQPSKHPQRGYPLTFTTQNGSVAYWRRRRNQSQTLKRIRGMSTRNSVIHHSLANNGISWPSHTACWKLICLTLDQTMVKCVQTSRATQRVRGMTWMILALIFWKTKGDEDGDYEDDSDNGTNEDDNNNNQHGSNFNDNVDVDMAPTKYGVNQSLLSMMEEEEDGCSILSVFDVGKNIDSLFLILEHLGCSSLKRLSINTIKKNSCSSFSIIPQLGKPLASLEGGLGDHNTNYFVKTVAHPKNIPSNMSLLKYQQRAVKLDDVKVKYNRLFLSLLSTVRCGSSTTGALLGIGKQTTLRWDTYFKSESKILKFPVLINSIYITRITSHFTNSINLSPISKPNLIFKKQLIPLQDHLKNSAPLRSSLLNINNPLEIYSFFSPICRKISTSFVSQTFSLPSFLSSVLSYSLMKPVIHLLDMMQYEAAGFIQYPKTQLWNIQNSERLDLKWSTSGSPVLPLCINPHCLKIYICCHTSKNQHIRYRLGSQVLLIRTAATSDQGAPHLEAPVQMGINQALHPYPLEKIPSSTHLMLSCLQDCLTNPPPPCSRFHLHWLCFAENYCWSFTSFQRFYQDSGKEIGDGSNKNMCDFGVEAGNFVVMSVSGHTFMMCIFEILVRLVGGRQVLTSADNIPLR